MSTPDPHVAAVARLLAAYPGSNIAALTQRLILEKLRAFPAERVTRGVEDLIEKRSGEYFPSVPDIMAFVRAVPVPADPAPEAPAAGSEPESGRFRGGVLKGQRWHRSEFTYADGTLMPMEETNIYRRAAAAMEEKIRDAIEQRRAERAAAARPVAQRKAQNSDPDWA